jgi:hypothetical protein
MSAAASVATTMDILLIDKYVSARNLVKILQMDNFSFAAALSNKIIYQSY